MLLFAYITRRLLTMIPLLLIVSVLTFIIIQLPPGDFFTSLQATVAETGGGGDARTYDILRQRYGLDQPIPPKTSLLLKQLACRRHW